MEKLATLKKFEDGNELTIQDTDRGIKLMLTYKSGWLTDWPVIHKDNTVAYNNPYEHAESTKDYIRENAEEIKKAVAEYANN